MGGGGHCYWREGGVWEVGDITTGERVECGRWGHYYWTEGGVWEVGDITTGQRVECGRWGTLLQDRGRALGVDPVWLELVNELNRVNLIMVVRRGDGASASLHCCCRLPITESVS